MNGDNDLWKHSWGNTMQAMAYVVGHDLAIYGTKCIRQDVRRNTHSSKGSQQSVYPLWEVPFHWLLDTVQAYSTVLSSRHVVIQKCYQAVLI